MKTMNTIDLFFIFKDFFKKVMGKQQNFMSMQLSDLAEYEKLKKELEEVEQELLARLKFLDTEPAENFDGFTLSELRKKYYEKNAIISALAFAKDKSSLEKMRAAQQNAEKIRCVIIDKMGKGER